MHTTIKSPWAAGLLLAFATPMLGLAQDADEQEGEQAAVTEEAPLELEEQRVTGSRMVGGDPSARVYSFSAEDISVRGLSSLEDLFRTLPFAFSSITTQTDMIFGGGASDTDKNLGALGLGTSTVNLQSLGSANTLVLVNGRRIAGNAGDEDDFANILTVPLSAIERVDIQLDGASAVYGADAIGGVVNFVTKKNYSGIGATIRNEWSSTDADHRKVSIQAGYTWASGNISGTISRSGDEPIDVRKAGWTSSDYRDRFGPEFDLRRTFYGQPGLVCEFNGSYRFPGCSFFDRTIYQLPPDHSGVGATVDDFLVNQVVPVDYVPPQNGSDRSGDSLNVTFEQYLTDDFRVYVDILYSDIDSYQEFQTSMTGYLVPASNAYNPFGRTMVVGYWPNAEVQSGLISRSYTESERKQRNHNVGFLWTFADVHQFSLNVTRSDSESIAYQIRPDYRRSEWDPTQEKFYAALASSDPNVALNVFGNGTAQSPGFAELFTSALGPSLGFTEKTTVDPLLRGEIFKIWGGTIKYAVGGEYRRTVIYDKYQRFAEGGVSESGEEEFIGVEEPTQELRAYFAELAFPIVGRENARPGINMLTFTAQARYDSYEAEGANGGVDFVGGFGLTRQFIAGQGWTSVPGFVGMNVGEPNIVKTKLSRTSPRFGIAYRPTRSVLMRAAWSRSFKAPVFSDTFSTRNAREFNSFYTDPHAPGGPSFGPIPTEFRSNNLDINAEHANKWSLGMDWSSMTIPGLRVIVDWKRTDFVNKIEYGSTLLYNHADIAFTLPQLVERDETGRAVAVYNTSINIAEKISESVDLHVEYSFDTAWGQLTPRINYYRVLDEFFRITPETEPVNRVGTQAGSDKYRINASLTWQRGRFGLDMFVYHRPGYVNENAVTCYSDLIGIGRCQNFGDTVSIDVGSSTTLDVTATYVFGNGLRLRAGGRNILDADAPETVSSNHLLPYDPTRWNGRGQILFIELNWELGGSD